MPETTTVIVTPASGDSVAIDFGTIAYTEEDAGKEYTYTVKEEAGNIAGVTYDSGAHTVTVTVTDNGDGTITADPEYSDGEGLVLTNEYNTGSVEAGFGVTKNLTGRALAENEFSFLLKGASGVTLQTKTNDAAGNVTFDKIKFEADGTYTYTITEEKGDADSITYDTHIVNVTVTVTDDGNGNLTADVKYDGATTFENTYEAKGSVVLEARKILTGKELAADQFTFELKAADGTVLDTQKNAADGKVTFKAIEYDQDDMNPGEFTYTISEVNDGQAGITYAGNVETIKVTLEDDGKGTITATADKTGAAVTFENTYAASGEVVLTAKKVLTGRELKENEFSFQLKNEAGEVLQTRQNAADGTVTFETISYKLEDVANSPFVYTISEVKGDADSITYDEHIETITVTLEDDGKGNITATADKTGAAITFENAYDAEGSFQLKGEKAIKGRKFKAGDTFTFTVEAAAGVPMPETTTVTVTPESGDSVAIDFGTIAYTEEDAGKEYTYTVKEEAGNIAGITYDAAGHTVTVKVEDNGDGTMTATATYSDGEKLQLTNLYGATGEWTLTANKTVDGQAATADQVFDFGLYENGILVGSIVKNNAGQITFPTVTYTEEDAGKTFTYTVKELGFSGTVSDTFSYVCDTTVHTVIVKVEDADGKLNITWENGDGSQEITFANTRLWKIELEKSDILNPDNKLPGAVYTLYKDEACTDKYADITTGVGGVGFLKDVPAGTYWVKETKAPAGYKVDPEAYMVTVPNLEDTSKPVFVPVQDYPMEGELTLDVEKVMTGREFKAGDTFTFTISAVSGVPMPEKTMVTINPTAGTTAKVDFGIIEYGYEDDGKTYEYTIKETVGDIQGVTYDTKFHTVKVAVTADADGENIIAVPTYSDGEKVILTNVYTAENELRLDVEKVIKGRAFQVNDTFTFTVEAAENVPMPEKTEVTIEPASGTTAVVDFGKITYSQDDVGSTYVYTVKETAGDLAGITYDAKAYTVRVAISDNGDGTLTVTPTYENGTRVTFTNTYTAAGTWQFTAQKHLDGKELEADQFTFVLMNEQGKELETAKNDATGLVSFRTMNFNQNDVGKTYAYRIAERNEGVTGYIYDTTEYSVQLAIADNGDGTLSVTATGIPEGGMVFENVFNELANFTVRKEWQGKEGTAITLILYRNGQKMEPQPAYVKSGNLYMYENLPVYDENDKLIVYSVKEAYMDGYMTIYENTGDYADVTDQVMNGGTIINRSVTDFAVRKVWEGLAEGEEAPAITLTLYCNGQKVDKPTPTPDKNGWYHYYNLPATVNGEEAVYTVLEEEMEGYATSYLSGGAEAEAAGNGDTIVNRKIPQTGDESRIGMWTVVSVLSGAAFILLMKKRREMNG